MPSQKIGNLFPTTWEILSGTVEADDASSSMHLLLQRERWYYPMKTDPSSIRFNAQKWHLMMAVLVLFFMIVGTIMAMPQHLPTDANQQSIPSPPHPLPLTAPLSPHPTL